MKKQTTGKYRLPLLLFLLCVLFCLGLVACARTPGTDEDEEEPVGAGDLVLQVYNWGEYISDGSLGSYDTNAEFEKYYLEKYGKRVRVVYTTYATNEDMYSKIRSGAGNYDIIIPSDYMIDRMAKEGLLYDFNPSANVENYGAIVDDFKGLYYDPENRYSVPYTYGKVGIIYNRTMVDEQDAAQQSWALLWNEKYRTKILQFNNPRDAFATAMYYKNLDVNSTDPAVWQTALDLLMEQKPLVQGYVSDEIFNKMTGASAAIGTYYAGDYITMVEDNEHLAFYYPKEGTNVFVDAMCIPKNAAHKKLAIEYINFMLSEQAAVANAVYIGYASPNRLVFENEEYKEEMGEDAMNILYSDVDVNENYGFDPYFHSFSPKIQELTNSMWESLKTESAIEVWVHIVSALIVFGALGFGVYTVLIRKVRSRHYRKRTAK